MKNVLTTSKGEACDPVLLYPTFLGSRAYSECIDMGGVGW